MTDLLFSNRETHRERPFPTKPFLFKRKSPFKSITLFLLAQLGPVAVDPDIIAICKEFQPVLLKIASSRFVGAEQLNKKADWRSWRAAVVLGGLQPASPTLGTVSPLRSSLLQVPNHPLTKLCALFQPQNPAAWSLSLRDVTPAGCPQNQRCCRVSRGPEMGRDSCGGDGALWEKRLFQGELLGDPRGKHLTLLPFSVWAAGDAVLGPSVPRVPGGTRDAEGTGASLLVGLWDCDQAACDRTLLKCLWNVGGYRAQTYKKTNKNLKKKVLLQYMVARGKIKEENEPLVLKSRCSF